MGGAEETAAALRAARATWNRDDRQRSAVYTTAETILDAFAGLPEPAPGPDGPIDGPPIADGSGTRTTLVPLPHTRRTR